MGTLGTSFGTAVGDYAAGRPGYPPDAIAWLLGSAPLTVADVGAGTGKLTQELVRQGHHVTAIDPDAEMLAGLRQAVPGVPTLEGTAESLPLADGSVDAVVFGQAWHWVDVPRASAEVRRVLKPGGTLGMVWNIRDAREPWVGQLTAAMKGSQAENMIAAADVEVAAGFTPLIHRTFEWSHTVTADALGAMVRSRSLYIAGDAAYKTSVDAAIAELVASTPGLDSDQGIALPYVTHVFKTTRAE